MNDPLTIQDQCSHHIEPSQLICNTIQLTGLYNMTTVALRGATWILSNNFTEKLSINLKAGFCKHST